ncbi:MAG: hypothetical protein ACREEE_04705 [Dongiaceae bacterium]
MKILNGLLLCVPLAIALAALRAGLHDVVKASIIGSIVCMADSTWAAK